jgi:glutathione S-transferase
VIEAGDALGVVFVLKDTNEPDVAEELIARGGKKQMPYLVDEDKSIEMYESEDIITYLHEHYG